MDISNVKTGGSDIHMGNKNNEYSTYDGIIANKITDAKQSSTFQTVNSYVPSN